MTVTHAAVHLLAVNSALIGMATSYGQKKSPSHALHTAQCHSQHYPALVPFHRNTCSLRNKKKRVNSNYF